MNELVSVIVPVYNVAKYLPKCIDSILNQTYQNLEVLLVDDGSTDESGHICDEYALKDSRIRVFHKENGGQGTARNLALDLISGEYVLFVDADDYIDLYAVEEVLKVAQNYDADIVATDFIIDTPFRQIACSSVAEEYILHGAEELLKAYLSGQTTGTVCNKLFKADLWQTIRFPEYRASEDNATTYRIMDLAKISVICPISFYHYVMREDSTENNIVIENHFASIKAAEDRYTFITNKYPDLEMLADKNRWSIRLAMYDRLFITGNAGKYKAELEKWLDFFRTHTAPERAMEIKQKHILQFPHLYGRWKALKINTRKTIKNVILKLKKEGAQ